MAIGGMLAAVAVVIMSLGGLVPLATFVCPTICILTLQVVTNLTTKRIGWAWYSCVSILCILLAPDKEAAAVFACLGFYPLIKSNLEKMFLSALWKLLFFNIAILAMYSVLINLFGMAYLAAEYLELGTVMLVVTLVLGNVTFLLLDTLLTRLPLITKKR